MNRDDDPQLWDLLGKAEPAEVSPFFARNVVRQARQEKSWADYVRGWLRPRRLVPASAVALVLLVSAWSVRSPKDASDNPPEMIATIDPQDYDTVADLDDLLAADDDGVWTEGESLSL